MVTTNRVQYQEKETPTIALNDFLSESSVQRRFLELYDGDLMDILSNPEEALLKGHIPDDIVEHLDSFQKHVFSEIERLANGRHVIINPYFSTNANHWRNLGYSVLGPTDELSYEHSKKSTTWDLAKNKLGIPCPEGEAVSTKDKVKELFKKYGENIFVSLDDDPLNSINKHVKSLEEIEELPESSSYLVTTWEKRL